MKTVVLDGVEYTKASVVAKEYKYTPDYIGQLARGKKISARLVGRTWYVSEDSLKLHQSKKHKKSFKSKLKVETTKSNIPNKKYVRRVESPLQIGKKTTRLVSVNDQGDSVLATVKYVPDDFSLVPKVNKVPKVSLLKVKIADATNLKVSSNTKTSARLKPEPLPEVFLSGNLSVEDITGDLDKKVSEQNMPKNNANSHIEVETKTKDVLKVPLKIEIEHESDSVTVKKARYTPLKVAEVRKTTVKPREIAKILDTPKKEIAQSSNYFVVITTFFAAVIISSLILITVSEVVISDSYLSANFGLEFEKLLDLFN